MTDAIGAVNRWGGIISIVVFIAGASIFFFKVDNGLANLQKTHDKQDSVHTAQLVATREIIAVVGTISERSKEDKQSVIKSQENTERALNELTRSIDRLNVILARIDRGYHPNP